MRGSIFVGGIAAMLAVPLYVLPAPAAVGLILDSDSPVHVTACEAFPEHVVMTANGHIYQPGHVPVLQRQGQLYGAIAMHLGAHLQNIEETLADSVQVRFQLYDSFETDTGVYYQATYHAQFAQGVDVDRMQHEMAYDSMRNAPNDIGGVRCFVTAVRFTDGTTWKFRRVNNTDVDQEMAAGVPSRTPSTGPQDSNLTRRDELSGAGRQNRVLSPNGSIDTHWANTYIEDRGHFLNSSELTMLDRSLAQFEKETTRRILLYTTDDMASKSLDTLATEIVRAHGANTGTLLLIVARNPKRVSVIPALSLHGVVSSADSDDIVRVMATRFSKGDFAEGIRLGVQAAKSKLSVSSKYSPTQ